MARIPIGSFGNVTAGAAARSNVQGGTELAIAQGLGAVGDALSREASYQKQVLDKKQRESDGLALSAATAKASSDIQLFDTNMTVALQNGQMTPDQAVTERQKYIQQVGDKHLESVPETEANKYKQFIELSAYRGGEKIAPVAIHAEQQGQRVKLEQIHNDALKLGDKGQALAIYQNAVNSSGLPSAEGEKNLLQFKNAYDLNAADVSFQTLRDDKEGLVSNFSSESLAKQFPDLQQDQYIALQKQAAGRLRQIDNEEKQALAARDREGATAVSDSEKILSSGILPSADKVQELRAVAKGTPHEAELESNLQAAQEVHDFALMSPEKRQIKLSQIQQQVMSGKSGDPERSRKILNLLQSANNTASTMEAKDNVSRMAVVTGKAIQNPSATAIVANDANAVSQIRNNILSLVDFNKTQGVTGSINPLSSETQKQLKTYWDSSAPEARLNTLKTLMSANVEGTGASKKMIQSIAGTSNAYLAAASLTNRASQNITLGIVKGQMLMEKGKVNYKTAEVDDKIKDYLDGIYTPNDPQYAIARDGIKAHYAYALSQNEKAKTDNGKYILDKDLLDDSARQVTGGRFYYGGYFGNNVVLRPHGVSDDSFENQLDKFNTLNARNYGSDRDYFKSLKMRQDPNNPNRYYFMDGLNPVKTPDNKGILFMTVR